MAYFREFKTYREMDVWQILTEQAWVDNKLPTSLTLGQVASQWLKKRVPLITVTVDYKKNRTTFTQVSLTFYFDEKKFNSRVHEILETVKVL